MTECRHFMVFTYDTIPPKHVCEDCGENVPLTATEEKMYANLGWKAK